MKFKVDDKVKLICNKPPWFVTGDRGIVYATDTGRLLAYLIQIVGDVKLWVEEDEIELISDVDHGGTKQMILTQDHAERKGTPIATGVMDYFPKALAYVSRVSKAGNDQHNPGQPLHWDKTKSKDHADCIARHLIDRGTVDPTDGLSHSGKLAWRALALLETELGNGTTK